MILLLPAIKGARATVNGPEYCPSGTYFDESLEDCLFTDGRGNNPDGTFCALEGCYSPQHEFLGLSPHHPAVKEQCGPTMLYDWKVDECIPSHANLTRSIDGSNKYANNNDTSLTGNQIDWTGICTTLQPALISPCTSLVSSNGTLTYEGNRAVGCIRNGAFLAAAAGFNAIPLDWIIGGLQSLEGHTGCGGIVNWEMVNQVGNTETILNLIPIGPT
jgi:hypothetical protein